MGYRLTIFATAQFAAALITLFTLSYFWKYRQARGSESAYILFLAILIWTFANGMETAAVTSQLKIFWSKIAYIGSMTSPVFLLLFAIAYTQTRYRLRRTHVAILLVVPCMTILLAATNEMHGLIWSGFSAVNPQTNLMVYDHGPWFWASMVYTFILIFISTVLFITATVRSQRLYRHQNIIMILACAIPWVASFMYLFDVNPVPGFDLISISFFFTCSLLLWGIYRERLLKVVPIPHDRVIENLLDGILVYDLQRQTIEINQAAETILEIARESVIGNVPETYLSFWDSVAPLFDGSETKETTVGIKVGGQPRYVLVRVTPIQDHRKRMIGWLMILDDITKRKIAEGELRKANAQLNTQLSNVKELQEELQQQAVRDSLTGVYNRRYLEEVLTREIARSDRKGNPLSVLMIDMDNFKEINDSFGHRVGDLVLRKAGEKLLSETRKCDYVCRYGGDEFVVVLPDTLLNNAIKKAQGWCADFRTIPFEIDSHAVIVTLSIGVAQYPQSGKDIDALLKKVDDHMYEAKHRGRDCVQAD